MRYILKLTLTAAWHSVYRKACKGVEVHRPFAGDIGIVKVCPQCGRTTKEFN